MYIIYIKRIIIVTLLFILPIIIILSFIFSGNAILAYYKLNLSHYIYLSLEEYISIYLSILSIEVSAILALAIYKWQYNDERRSEIEETQNAKRILKALLINATKRAFEVYNNPNDNDSLECNFVRITDNHIGLIAAIGDLLTEEEFLYLNLLMETLKDMADNERNDYLYEAKQALKKYMNIITLPFYPLYHFKMTQLESIYDVMTNDSVKIFELLTGTDIKESIDSSKENLFEYDHGYFKVYDSYGDLLCNAAIDDQGVLDGEAKIFNDGIDLEFEGEIKDRKKCGEGTEYFTLWYSGKVKKTGIWKDDVLIKGTVYNVILDNNNELYILENEKYNQLYDDFFSLHTMIDHEPKANIATITINHGVIQIDKESIVPITSIAEEQGYYVDLK